MKKKSPEPKYIPRKNIEAKLVEGVSQGIAFGRSVADEAYSGARVMCAAEGPSGLHAQIDLPDLAKVLRDRTKAVQSGDLSGIEAALTTQAAALQSLFTALCERAMRCDSVPAFEVNMRMALRAQNQSRATAETLANIKNPPNVSFVRQANIANGPQQVNNGAPSRAGKGFEPNKLLEPEHEAKWLDTRATHETSRSDSEVETVEAIDRSAHGRG